MKTTLLLIVTLASFAIASTARAGNEGGHGGDPYTIEFETLALSLSQGLASYETANPALFSKWHFTAAQWEAARKNTRVVSDETVSLRGHDVDATNDSTQNLIDVSRQRWREATLRMRLALVLHEYFGIIAVEQDQFDASADFSGFIDDTTKKVLADSSADSSNDAFMGNLFYGKCDDVPPLFDTSSCAADSMANTINCAQTQAEGLCRMSGKSQCQLISTTLTPMISDSLMGLHFCEALVIMK
jgi:hypothetical protein